MSMRKTYIVARLENGTEMHGPVESVMSWLTQQMGYRPWENLPITIKGSPYVCAKEAYDARQQWTEYKN